MNKDPKQAFDFTGATALIAGGATGLGLEMARGLLAHGCRVALMGRRKELCEQVAAELCATYDDRCVAIPGDISDEASMRSVAQQVAAQFDGELNIAINSAGFNIRNPIEKVSLDEWESVQRTNATGGFLFARELFPLLKKASFGRLINVVSIFGSHSFPDRVSYSSSKGSLLQLTRTLAIEWASYGITVNAISPGPFLTDINKAVLDNKENYEKFCQKIPIGRFGDPQEVTTSALFLASPASTYVTGADIMVDGAWTIT